MVATPSEGKTSLFLESAKLVKEWASLPVEGSPLREYLRFYGVSLWDIVAPYLAVYVLPEALARCLTPSKTPLAQAVRNLFQGKMKPRLRWCRDRLRELEERRRFHKLPPPQEEEALRLMFLSFEPRQIEVFAPVMELESFRQAEITIVGTRYRPVKEKFLKPGKVRFIAMEDLYYGEALSRVKADRKLLREKLSRLLKDKGFREALSYQGCPLWSFLKDEFFNLSCHTLPQMVKLLALGEGLLQREKPHIIVGADDWDERARVYFLIGRKRRIPTLHIQYGLAINKMTWRFMSTDKAAIFDERTYQALTEMGLDGKDLVITGNSRFDYLVNGKSTKNEIYRQFKITPNYRTVLFTSQPNVADCFPNEEIRKRLITTIYNAVTQLPDTLLIVKPHPDENARFHQQLKSKFNSVVLTEQDFDTQKLILACDAMVTFHSTTALEALIADKPVILVKIPGKPDPRQYFEKGAVLGVESESELISALNNIFNDLGVNRNLQIARQKFGCEQGYIDGKASDRIRELIFSMIRM